MGKLNSRVPDTDFRVNSIPAVLARASEIQLSNESCAGPKAVGVLASCASS
jgi:hypothetical protein